MPHDLSARSRIRFGNAGRLSEVPDLPGSVFGPDRRNRSSEL